MANERTYDEVGNVVELNAQSFDFCQKDKKIHDVKFETKATTFAKDAFKRFCKNKSSVVAACIIGILLLMSFIVPIVSPYNITQPELRQAFLEPRIAAPNAESALLGTWDGTVTYENILYDPATEGPVGFQAGAVVKVLEVRDTQIDVANDYAHGGTFIYKAKGFDTSKRDFAYLQQYKNLTYTQEDAYKVSFNLGSELLSESDVLAEYRIVLQNGTDTNSFIVLKDWSNTYGEFEIDISDVLTQNGKNNYNGKIRIDAKASTDSSKDAALYINEIKISSSYNQYLEAKNAEIEDAKAQAALLDPEKEEDKDALETINAQIATLISEANKLEDQVNLIDDISLTDANAVKKATPTKNNTVYWQSTGETSVVGVYVTYWDFVYDTYEANLGAISDFVIGKTIMDQYIANGWCEYDWKKGIKSFKILDYNRCPIIEVTDQVQAVLEGGIEVNNLTTKTYVYRYLGYEKMPSFMFGTDSSGYDLFKKAFNCLKTSLLLAFITSAICFSFGLVWGSISGYFGGTVDLAMERFCEILGGMPWIVMMTLAIILLGNNLVTFGMALCLTGWMGTAGRTRTQFYRFKGREYVLSARTLGSSDMRLIFKHILPNSLGTIVTGAVLMIPSCIFSESTLSYLNLGLKGVDSFGNILADNQVFLSTHPALILFPALIISLLMISFNLFGNGLRDALNPSLKGSE